MINIHEIVASLPIEQRAFLEQKIFRDLGIDDNIDLEETSNSILPRKIMEDPITSFGQRRLWLVDQLEIGNPAYNSPDALRIHGELNIDFLKRGVNVIIERHESLRTTFHVVDGEPVQKIAPFLKIDLPVIDLAQYGPAEREDCAQEVINEASRRPFDLTNGPIIRALLVRLNETDHILMITLHHIASDGWSMRNLFEELMIYYNAELDGVEPDFPHLPIQYADYAIWQRERLQGDYLEIQLDYWREQLAHLPTLDLPTDFPRPPIQKHEGRTLSLEIPERLIVALKQLGQGEVKPITLFMSSLATFKILLSRYSGQKDIVIGTSIAGRDQIELEKLIGFFVNTLILRTDISGQINFRELLRRVRDVCIDAFTHHTLPFDQLVDALQPKRDPSRMPLHQVLFQVQEKAPQVLDFSGLKTYRQSVETNASKFDLMVSIIQNLEGGYRMDWEYNAMLFEAETITRMMKHYLLLLHAVVANPNSSLAELPLLTEKEQNELLDTFNDTSVPYPRVCLHELFEEQVEKHPNAIALLQGDESITYEKLNSRANQLAHYLRKRGVGPGKIVGICTTRSVEMVVGLLGILKAGGAYLPLDPSYPKERLSFMLTDARAQVLLCQQRLVYHLPTNNETVVYLDNHWHKIEKESENNLNNTGVTPADLVYVIYTSGSTGKPKGVLLDHQGRVNNFTDFNRRFEIGIGDRLLLLSSLSFDMCAYDVFGSLAAGATIILPKSGTGKDPSSWAQEFIHHRITIWHSVPTLMEMLLTHVASKPELYPRFLRIVLLGGDWISVSLPDRLKSIVKDIQVISLGGATEASMDSTVYSIEDTDPNWKSIPYGRPLANQNAYVLDENLQPLPIGVSGELYLGGDGLAWGYLNRPDLTAEKFIPNPFTPNKRLYKTGDLACYGSDGNLILLGRLDLQVKVRGFRIELGEIEVALKQHPLIIDAVVIARQDQTGDNPLVAYIVLSPSSDTLSHQDVRRFLAQQLPQYMLPSSTVILDTLPLSPNGKIDRKALPSPTYERCKHTVVLPRTPDESKLMEIWSSILKIPVIGIQDNFFDLGGDSFKAFKVVHALNGVISLVDLFKQPTIEQLALLLSNDTKPQSLLHKLSKSAEEQPLNLVCIPYGGGNAVVYQPLAECLPQVSVYAVDLPNQSLNPQIHELQNITEIATQCVKEIKEMVDGPVALYGQCVGAALTLEIAHILEREGVNLTGIFLGGILFKEVTHSMIERDRYRTQNELGEFLKSIGGFEEILDPQEMASIIAAVKRDMLLAGEYFCQIPQTRQLRLKAPIHCLIGEKDPTTKNYKTAYQDWTLFSELVKLSVIDGGGHYFIKHQSENVAQIISQELSI